MAGTRSWILADPHPLRIKITQPAPVPANQIFQITGPAPAPQRVKRGGPSGID